MSDSYPRWHHRNKYAVLEHLARNPDLTTRQAAEILRLPSNIGATLGGGSGHSHGAPPQAACGIHPRSETKEADENHQRAGCIEPRDPGVEEARSFRRMDTAEKEKGLEMTETRYLLVLTSLAREIEGHGTHPVPRPKGFGRHQQAGWEG